MTLGVFAVSQALTQIAASLVLLAGIVGSLTVLAKFPPIGGVLKWVWSHLVGQPVSAWFRAQVAAEVVPVVERAVSAEFAKLAQPNGGKSLADLAEALKRIEQRQTDITGETPTIP
jgi:hypothetical protein